MLETCIGSAYNSDRGRREPLGTSQCLEGQMSFFSMPVVQFIATTLGYYVVALFALMVVVGVVRCIIRRVLKRVEPDPNEATYPTEVPWV